MEIGPEIIVDTKPHIENKEEILASINQSIVDNHQKYLGSCVRLLLNHRVKQIESSRLI